MATKQAVRLGLTKTTDYVAPKAAKPAKPATPAKTTPKKGK